MQSKPQPSQTVARQYGTSGRPVKVLANTFAIKTLPTQTIYHYDGEFLLPARGRSKTPAWMSLCPSNANQMDVFFFLVAVGTWGTLYVILICGVQLNLAFCSHRSRRRAPWTGRRVEQPSRTRDRPSSAKHHSAGRLQPPRLFRRQEKPVLCGALKDAGQRGGGEADPCFWSS